MKFLISLLLFTVSTLLVSVSAGSTQDRCLELFLRCLPLHVRPSNPISEVIFTQSNSSFPSALSAYIKNRRFLTPSIPKPLAIVAAKHESHVQATIYCAKYYGLQLRIRSGGHDYEGLSYRSDVPFVVLDMFNLRSIDINIANGTAWVQAGATMGELYHKISNTSRVHAFPAGVCPTLGAGGHISGGGYGNLMRKYGLSVDNVIDAQLVDVNGRILNRKSMGEDLFWAIRGGGGASFGVILAWKIKLVPVPEKVTVFSIGKTREQGAADVVYKWQQVASKLPKDIFLRAQANVVNGSKAGEKTISVTFIGLFLGKTDNLVPLMNKRFPELGLQPKDCLEMSWVESAVYWANFPNGTSIDVLLNRTTKEKFFSKSKSDYVKNVIPKEALEEIWKGMINVEKMFMQWNPYGGRMSEISESTTPFPHRAGILFKIQNVALWEEEGTNATNLYINKIRHFYASLAPYVSKNPREAFLNYRDLDIGSNPSNNTSFKDAEVYGAKFFKGNFKRLVEVKAKVDPENFFKHEQSIPPGHNSN
ncbi:FAD-binding Berberine family protein [Melia azedarach]|uniref:FAD-binding Berberine family protein n=1 Tax=Melia azedarach TaxID=155640 RepID=A0ACC1Y3C7_MELAZ|nr:FAD-binding Berberine family protein [Melia azedarach]